MAQFTYIDIKKGKRVCLGNTLMLYHQEHIVSQDSNGYYLKGTKRGNHWIFEHLNIKNKYKFCECPSERGLFPYSETLEDLTKVIKKLWEYNPICKGDKVKVRDIHESPSEYAIYVAEGMEALSGRYIQSGQQFFDEAEENVKYGVYAGINAEGWSWSLDTLDLSTIEKADIAVGQLEPEPFSMKMDYPLTQKECISATGLILPRKSKNLKITL